MPGNQPIGTAPRTPARLPAVLTRIPVQLLLVFVTGGAFGREASLAALLVSLGASAALVWYVVRIGAWRAPRWRVRGTPAGP